MSDADESAASRRWCVAAALKNELLALRSHSLPGVVLLETGVGPENAHRSIHTTTADRTIGGIIHIGFAGALTRALDLGDVVVARLVEGDGFAPIDLSKAALGVSAVLDGVRHHCGIVLTRDTILATADDKRAAARQCSADEIVCIDMESASVAAVCAERAIPYIGLRAITDTFDEDLPLDLNECRGRDGNFDTMRVMWAAAHHPSAIGGLIELRRRARVCANTLAVCVSAVVSAFPTPEAYRQTLSA